MKNPASSSRAEPARWYRQRWPWLLIAGPAIVVVASLASAWLAVASDDGVVAQDYYKQGLLINKRLRDAAPDPQRNFAAVIEATPDGAVRVRIDGLPGSDRTARLRIAVPTATTAEEIVALTRDDDGDFVGHLRAQRSGRTIVTLEVGTWRLPITVVSAPWSEIRLGLAAGS
jgi:hypothetical protein